jgi:cellulose synthase/poly-beta-1,6-N-acetylglucosamine synthase-like glycosyltransferase
MPEHLSPLVSIIVPFFNEQDSLVELVREIESQFTAIKHELILVDDGSTDASLKVALCVGKRCHQGGCPRWQSRPKYGY